MKKIYLILIFGSFFGSTSCVKTDDFEIPVLEEDNIAIDGDFTSITAVKGNFNFENEEIYTFQDSDTWFEGYVISDDSGGNFYKRLIVQDKPENPTAGIQILLDDNSLFETYNFGRKIFVKLDGLSLGRNNGVLQLGIQNRGDVVAIPNALIDDHIIRSEVIADIKPLPLKISEFTSEKNSLFVELNNIQLDLNFVRPNQVFSFASNPYDQYDGERQMESCATGETVFLSTSTFSNFKSLLLPTGSGTIQGVLTRDFYDEHYVIIVNDPNALDMNGERCDKEFLQCDSSSPEPSMVIFEENFDGVTSQTILNSRKWTNINVSGGEKRFTPTMVNGNRLLRISAYNTLESPLEAWLVSPVIDLDESSGELVEFDLLASYDNGLFMEVFITQDFSGDPRTTEWRLLDAHIPLGPSGGNTNIFKKSKIDISCLDGKVWIGFRYLGAAPDKTTTYDLDNFRVLGN